MDDSKRRTRALRITLLSLRLSRHWLRVVITALMLYVMLAFAAPVLIHIGATGPGELLYRLYGPFCHQFAFRSVFLFGEQPFYPRSVTALDLTPFEPYALGSPVFRQHYTYWYGVFNHGAAPGTITQRDIETMTPWLEFASRDFYGTPQMGYKTALCQRDIAIYGSMLVVALLYAVPVVRRRLRPAPVWLFAFLGLGPVGIDGMSQLISYPPFGWWPPRETLPIFRIVTGILFGIMFAWLFLPRLDRSFAETAQQIEHRLRAAGIQPPSA